LRRRKGVRKVMKGGGIEEKDKRKVNKIRG